MIFIILLIRYLLIIVIRRLIYKKYHLSKLG